MADYISRKKVLEKSQNERIRLGYDVVSVRDIESIPAADVVEVVRCKDCEFSRELTKTEKRLWLDECRACESLEASQSGYMIVFPEHFCSYGERRNE